MSLKPKTYVILSEAIDSGVTYGVNRRCREKLGLLDIDDYTATRVADEISESVLTSICEYFDIDDDDQSPEGEDFSDDPS